MSLRVLKIVFNQLRVGSERILVFDCILWVQMISLSGLLIRGMPYLLLQLPRMLFSTITVQRLFTRILFLRLFRSFFCQALLLKYLVLAPHVVNPLSVSIQSCGKKRLIPDLRHVNKHIWKNKFKFEDVKNACVYLPFDHFMLKFDLKSGCHHIDILQEHQIFWGFFGL